MGDGVKGSLLDHLDREIRIGVRLHRAIDHFTDTHEQALAGKKRLWARSGKYAGVVLDMLYDHLLAAHWNEHHESDLQEFLRGKYRTLFTHSDMMPERIRFMLPHMIAGDWLGNYAQMEGISRALNGLSRRASNSALIKGSEEVLELHYDQFREEFGILFKDARSMAEGFLEKEGI